MLDGIKFGVSVLVGYRLSSTNQNPAGRSASGALNLVRFHFLSFRAEYFQDICGILVHPLVEYGSQFPTSELHRNPEIPERLNRNAANLFDGLCYQVLTNLDTHPLKIQRATVIHLYVSFDSQSFRGLILHSLHSVHLVV